MIRRTTAIAALLAFTAPPAFAQRASPVAVPRAESIAALTQSQRVAAVDAIVAVVRAQYVMPERIPAIEARLRESFRSGRYDVEAPGVFAERLTEDLRQSSSDRHMYLNFDPAQFALAPTSADDAGRGQAMADFWRRRAERSNHGLAETRILAGNVRYVRITGFHWVDDETGAAYDAVARFLRDGDAIIIDVRGNGGGSHGGVRYLISHFLEPNLLEMTFLRSGEPPFQSRTLEYLPSGRLTGRPLHILIDGRTGSAAEAFAYDVQQFRVGRLVGQTSGGAANNNSFVRIAPAFMLSVSTGRPEHPVSGTNWEAVGVVPDVAVPPAQALERAHAMALAELLARSDADLADRSDWEWAQASVAARMNPVRVAEDRLRPLAGTYGTNRILFRDGGLWLERAERQPGRLLPMDDQGLFTVDGYDDALRLRLTGPVMEIMWINEPAPLRIERSGDAVSTVEGP